MNKNEFLRAIADKTESTIKDANAFYEAFVATVREAMKANDKITLVGFGTFAARKKAACVRPNPQKKGATIKVKACTVPSLRFGKSYKESIN